MLTHPSTIAKTINAAVILQSVKHNTGKAFATKLDPIIHFANNLPACSGNILEWHLDEDHFDFAYRLTADFDRPILNDALFPNNTPRHIGEGYHKLVNEQKTAFKFGIENVWIEYDAPFNNAPALFFDIHRDAVIQPKETFRELENATRCFNYQPSQNLLLFLQKVHANSLTVVYFGLMFSRESKAMRLTINGIEPNKLTETLKALGWKGDYDALKILQTNYLDDCKKIVLAVDFDDQLQPRIGVEMFDEDYNGSMEQLHRNQLLNLEQLQLLEKWEGRFDFPPSMANALSQLHQRPIKYLYTRINHFKFILDGHNKIVPKAYLYYCF